MSGIRLDAVTKITRLKSPTEIDHYQIQRVIDACARSGGSNGCNGTGNTSASDTKVMSAVGKLVSW